MPAWLPDPLRYPLRGERRGDTFAAAWLALLLHGIVPVLPLVPLAGILVRVLAATLDGEDEPPDVFEDALGLVRSGLRALAIGVAYLAVPLGLLLFVLGGASGGGGPPSDSLLVLAATSVGAVVLLVAAYLLPVGLAAYASTGALGAAFDRARLRGVARSGRYLLGWLAGVVLADAGGLLAAALAGRGTVGWLLATLVGAYVLLAGARLFGASVAGSGNFD